MIIYPAIDIHNGKCVRLYKGDLSKQTIFSNNPTYIAQKWENEGAEYLHLVDLDGAFNGKSINIDIIKNIVDSVKIPIQIGGGIRDINTIDYFFNIGVSRVILGSVAIKSPKVVEEACIKYPNSIVVGIDAVDGIVAIEGWAVTSGATAISLAKEIKNYGISTIIYTDISLDGTLSGVNVDSTVTLAQNTGLNVIASGGVNSIKDINYLKSKESEGITGVIVGKSIYTGHLSLSEAITVAR